MPDVELLTKQAALDECCTRWRAAGVFAFDTEFIRDETYESKLCLVQVAAEDDVILIDPTGKLDLAGFWELVADKNVVTIVHAGKEDFELCLRATGKPPRNLFDIQVAAGFVGYGYPMSLARLVQELASRRLSKGQTLTDWLRRPLTDAQMRYAVDDVKYLPLMYDRLRKTLRKLGRTTWAQEEFARFEDPQLYIPPVRDRLYRLKGTKRLDGLGLAVLERLIEWRDTWAQEKNRPTRALVRDDVLVEIARRRPRRATDLEVMRGFPQSRNKRVVKQVLDLIEETRATPSENWPKAWEQPEELPMARAMLDVLSAVTRAICEEEKVSHELVGTAQRLRDLLDYHGGRRTEKPLLLSGWRDKFIGQRLVDLLEGRSELHVSGWPEAPRLEVVTHNNSAAT